MKYVLLAYRDEKRWHAMTASARDTFKNACLANDEVLRKSGHLLAGEGLQESSSATTLWVRNGKLSVTSGPFIQTKIQMKEQLIGVCFIDARDLNNAIYVASKMPQARVGSIEVRPMPEFDR